MTLATAEKSPAILVSPIGAKPEEMLSFFNSTSDWTPVLRLLAEKNPIVNQRFRYKRQTGYYRYVYAIDIALLLAAGFTHSEIGDFYNTKRQSISFMAAKLRQGGVSIRLPQRPRHESQQPKAKPQKPDRRQRLVKVINGLKQGKYATSQVIKWLQKQDEYYDRRFAKRHLLVGVGPGAERYLEWLQSNHSEGWHQN